MGDLLRSKLGAFFSSVYLIIVLYAMLEGVGKPPEAMQAFALMILTAPFSFLLALLLESIGILTSKNAGQLVSIPIIFGAIANLAIFYLIGCGVARIFVYLDPGMISENEGGASNPDRE